MTDALASLYGAGHAKASASGIRNHTVLTSQPIVDGLLEMWPEGVAYDPCGPYESKVVDYVAMASGSAFDGYLVGAKEVTSTRGLIDLWPDRTYANVPFGASLFDPETEADLLKLEQRLRVEAKAEAERRGVKKVKIDWPEGLPLKKAGLKDWLQWQLEASQGESILLAPNRTNRSWLREWRREVTGLVELNPITFVGSEQCYPAPLVLGFVGSKDRLPDFWGAFEHIGERVGT